MFAAAGHGLMHMLTAFFFVVVLALEDVWTRPYHELISLWTPGALLVGLAALPAGWLADRWNAPSMLVIMFLGLGAACFACAVSSGPRTMMVSLAALGLFAAIYHPVAIPWLVRSSRASGKALGINGIFGGLGVAAAGVVTGALIDNVGWRAAFVVPGLVATGFGVALLLCQRAALIGDGERPGGASGRTARATLIQVFCVLMFTMFCLGFIYQSTQTAFPKVFDLRLAEFVGDGTLGVGLVVSFVYGLAALMQFAGGHLADRFPLRPIYLLGFLLQAPLLIGIAAAFGVPLVAAATMAVLLSTGVLPAENMLLARYSPRRHQSLAFGIKFVLAFGTAPLAIWYVAWLREQTGEFRWLFLSLAVLAVVAAVATLLLPGEDRTSRGVRHA